MTLSEGARLFMVEIRKVGDQYILIIEGKWVFIGTLYE